ncbi:MAG TPA: response regulator transcription factor [Polyangia bacterium]|nr:response regulator transcription factor [Polyangia bacterium]
MPTRVLIVDDHTIVREGLKQILDESANITVAGEAASGQDALTRLREESYDVVLLDISLEDRSGLDILKQIKGYWPKLPVLILTMHREDEYAIRSLRAGAAGYLTKKSAPTELVAAIEKVASGGKYVSASLAERLAFAVEPGRVGALHEALTDREFQVFSLIVAGNRITEIANQLCLSVKTVSSHRAHILEKMKMRTVTELIRYAVENGLAK